MPGGTRAMWVVLVTIGSGGCNQVLGIEDLRIDPGCEPLTCEDVDAECGPIDDGCDDTTDCGGCSSPNTCGGGGTDALCGCTPRDCESLGANCGAPSDGCFDSLPCGTCTLPQECSGGGAAFVCGTPGMATLVGGSFLRGCNTAVDTSCDADESPSRSITLAGFEIDLLEVSQARYNDCVLNGPCATPPDYTPVSTPNLPVVSVTYGDAVTYCTWVGHRLPSEAEWERAARGGDGRLYPWGGGAPVCSLVNYASCGNATLAVGTLVSGAAPSGALDMAGNVSEWVADFYEPGYYAAAPDTDPTGPATGTIVALRGGSFVSASAELRTSARESADPATRSNRRGFRCARTL